MSHYVNNTYTIEKNFNDLGQHLGNLGFAGKTEVTILDNLYRISQLLHGRILCSSSILGGYKVYVPKSQLRELIIAYQSISPYKLSDDIDPLIQSLRQLIPTNSVDVEVGIDSRITMQMISVHNTISMNLKTIWEGVVSLRLMSCSGFNKDITIDGRQQTFDLILSKFGEGQINLVKSMLERSGQLAGIKCSRQVEMRDMIADLLFSRKDSYVTLHQLFFTMKEQRMNLRKFRTDILFCPVNRYSQLDSGLNVSTLMKVTKTDTQISLRPDGFEFAEFQIRNEGYDAVSVTVAGSIGSGKYDLAPLQSIQVFGTELKFDVQFMNVLKIEGWCDIRTYQKGGDSIVSMTLNGKLREDAVLSHFFFQIIKPVMKYLNSFVTKVRTSESLKIVIAKMPEWVGNIFENLQPGHIYSGWLLTDATSQRDRILYIYMLTMMLPELLLDPTFTFSDVTGTPPYVHDYSMFAQSLKRLYE